MGDYAIENVNRVVNDNSMSLNVKSTDAKEPMMGEIGRVDMANLVRQFIDLSIFGYLLTTVIYLEIPQSPQVSIGKISPTLEDGQLKVVVRNVTFASETNVSASVWPLPVTEETVLVDMWMDRMDIGWLFDRLIDLFD